MKPVDFDNRRLDQVLAEGLSSLHPGGSQALFADASVKFIEESIDLETFRELLTRDGDEEMDQYGRRRLSAPPNPRLWSHRHQVLSCEFDDS